MSWQSYSLFRKQISPRPNLNFRKQKDLPFLPLFLSLYRDMCFVFSLYFQQTHELEKNSQKKKLLKGKSKVFTTSEKGTIIKIKHVLKDNLDFRLLEGKNVVLKCKWNSREFWVKKLLKGIWVWNLIGHRKKLYFSKTKSLPLQSLEPEKRFD